MGSSRSAIHVGLLFLCALSLSSILAKQGKEAPKGGGGKGGKKEAPPPAPPVKPSLVVEAKLLLKSPTPTPEMHFDVFVYGEGYVIYQYEVTKVVEGNLNAKKILVAHWGLKRRIVQPVTETPVGASLTLSLNPFKKEEEKSDKVFVSDTTQDAASPLFEDVNQKFVIPPDEAGRWSYATSIGRVMRSFHLLRNQLKLVVLGDCQGWFSSRTRLYFPEENLKTPVALCMTQERCALSFFEMLAKDYLVHCPKLEWVVFAYQIRWLNGQANWAGGDSLTTAFKNSPGYQYDHTHAKEVFAPVDHKPIELKHILATPEYARSWNGAPWGELGRPYPPNSDLLTYDLSTLPPRVDLGKGRTLEDRKNNPQWSAQRSETWERTLKFLVDRKIRVLAYSLAVDPKFATLPKKDKNGTSAECYGDQLNFMKELEEKYKGYFFFFDYCNGGDSGLTAAEAGTPDHNRAEGAVKCTAAMNQLIRELIKKHTIPTYPVGAPLAKRHSSS